MLTLNITLTHGQVMPSTELTVGNKERETEASVEVRNCFQLIMIVHWHKVRCSLSESMAHGCDATTEGHSTSQCREIAAASGSRFEGLAANVEIARGGINVSCPFLIAFGDVRKAK